MWLTGAAVYVDAFPRTEGETDDSPRITRAIASAVTLGVRAVAFWGREYTLASTVTIASDYLSLVGLGRATILQTAADVPLLSITGNYVTIRDMTIKTTTTARTTFSVVCTDVYQPHLRDLYFSGVADARRSGVHLSGGSMGIIDRCTFSHSCIRVETWDVKIDKCYIWAMTCDYGIGVFSGTGNLTVSNTDVVPPLTSNVNGIAGIYVDAAGASMSLKFLGVYLDGNPDLVTGIGMKVSNTAGSVLISGVNANKMDSDCIVIDSAYGVTVADYIGIGNNASGLGSREIVVTQTGGQPTEAIQLKNISCVQTTAVPASPVGAAPAIYIDSSVTSPGKVTITDFSIKQPSGGGGYTLPEVSVPCVANTPLQHVTISGRGQLSLYSLSGSVEVDSGASGVTISLTDPYPIAYRPDPSKIKLATTGAILPPHRIQFITDSSIYVAFASAISGSATLYWSVTL